MLIAAVLMLCVAAATAALGVWSMARPQAAEPVGRVLRAVAPTQLAAAVMLTAGGVVALAAPHSGPVLLALCVIGAVGTVAAGCYQSAKSMAAAPSGCTGSCASCTLSCG